MPHTKDAKEIGCYEMTYDWKHRPLDILNARNASKYGCLPTLANIIGKAAKNVKDITILSFCGIILRRARKNN